MSKKIAAVIIAIFAVLQVASLQIASAQSYGGDWDIKNYDTEIQINADSTINVTEHIVADFTRSEHHGIIRIIPVKYTDTNGKHSEIPIHIQSITDENGKSWNYKKTNEGKNLSLKIGDPDVLLQTVTTYNISYKAERAIGNYEDFDELYWNATGDQWAVPILNASATVKLPKTVDTKNLTPTCYTGSYGSKEKNCTKQVVNDTTFKFTAVPQTKGEAALFDYEGLTIVAGFPKGIVSPTPPSTEELFETAPFPQKIFYFFVLNWGLLIPLIVGAIMTFIWYTRGRDPQASNTAIMPLYEAPDKLKPAEVGTIIDESVDTRDITSTLIDLAVRGYLKIVETKNKVLIFHSTDYVFHLLKKDYANDPKLESFEKKILAAVFNGSDEKNLALLNNEFYKSLPGIKKDIYEGLIRKGYFSKNPDKVRSVYQTTGSCILIGLFFGLGGLISTIHWSITAGIVISGFIILIFAKFMPARTLKGAETRYKILGLQEFIKTAETDRLKFQEKDNIFEKILPYAMTMGIAAKWTQAFEGIYKTPPSWYSSSDPNFIGNFRTTNFLNRLDSLSSNMSSTFTSSPRSSGSGGGGGGFSGGGGGGGGGGGW